MKRYRILLLVVLCLPLVQRTFAQTTSTTTASALPRLVRFSDAVKDLNGNSPAGLTSLTFALYSEQTSGAPLWMETQNVATDRYGHYTALLGATNPEGLPAELFTSEQARWVGVQIQGQPEQPRVLLVSAPYALKAGDAETIGGLPPSAFVLASASGGPSAAASGAAGSAGQTNLTPETTTDVTTTGGTANYLTLFNGTSTIVDSVVYQSAAGNIGINISTPAGALDVRGSGIVRGTLTLPESGIATATADYNSQPLDLTASAFSSGTSAAVTQTFQLKAEPVGNDTATPGGVLSVLYGSGTNTPAETGLQIASNGVINFASGQTFPGGGGTITGVTAGTGLSGGGSSGNVTLNSTGILGIAAGTGIAVGSGQTPTVSVSSTVPLLASANTFTADQTVDGNLSATGTVAASGYQIGGQLFDSGTYSAEDAFLGFGGNTTMTGTYNTAIGIRTLAVNTTGDYNTAVAPSALSGNTTGAQNTASGVSALAGNTTGSLNTAVGMNALIGNGTGSFNTAIGFETGLPADLSSVSGSDDTLLGVYATLSTGTLSNATAIGANAEVGESNAIVLGGITDVNNGTSVNVGIGTTTPKYKLDVHGTGNFTGSVSFSAGQTFPGTGTISDVTAGTGLSGGGSSGSVTLNNTGILGLTAGTGISIGSGQTPTVSVSPAVPLLAAVNTFTGNQTVNGNLSATGVVTGSGFQIGTNLFAFGDIGSGNAFLGFAGNTSMTGVENTAIGQFAFSGNTTGADNTASGSGALGSNSTGNYNTGVGSNTGYARDGSYLTGNYNTFLGAGAGTSTGTLSNATAIGANAVVGASNALVLGAITGVNQGTSVNVGIGTTTPAFTLDVIGNANFSGNVTVGGTLSKEMGTFKIDHPLDPANKYLYHSFVESPDMMDIYNGMAALDAHGAAWITMPDYFQALNRDFRYQLTSVGKPQPNIYIAEEISGNRFKVAGGKPGGKVSWQVTGIRQDAYANAHRVQVEEAKEQEEQGHYLHPELFGAPPELAVGYRPSLPSTAARAQASSEGAGLPPSPAGQPFSPGASLEK
jgi:hypothetical protein